MSGDIRYNITHSVFRMIFLGITVVLILCNSSVLPAAQQADDMTIQTIESVPDINPSDSSDVQDDLNTYNDQGTIDRIAADEMVIGDTLYKFTAPNIASGFSVGDYVRIIKNNAGKIIRLEKIKASLN